MINVLISGACGKMGKKVAEFVKSTDDMQTVCGVDTKDEICDFPVFHSFADVSTIPDVIIDFSHISALDGLLNFAQKNNLPVVLATTGYSAEQIDLIKKAGEKIPIFFTANMSLGINLLRSLVKTAAGILGTDFDVEIIEKHHNQKIDAPSGTALMLANAINDTSGDIYNYEYDRHSKRNKRPKNEIGIHSVRGGTIAGEHDVIFAGHDEVITLSHSAASKEVFAKGAVKAARFIVGKGNGMYDMNDVLGLN